jgi:hypothetical protein
MPVEPTSLGGREEGGRLGGRRARRVVGSRRADAEGEIDFAGVATRVGDRRAATLAVGATVVVIGVIAGVAAAVIYARGLVPRSEQPIRSDGLSYYLYLPAALLDHDLSFRTTLARDFGGRYRVADLVLKPRGYLDKHPPGEAIMLLPFFAIGHLGAAATGSHRTGFSRPYQIAAVAGGLVYTLVGLVIVGVVLLRWFDKTVVSVTLVLLTFGTNLFHYATYDAVYSHAFSFALVALVVERTLSCAERPRAGAALGLGAGLGLLADVRLPNLTVTVFPLCVLLWQFRSELRKQLPLLALAVGTAAFVFVPQVLYWYRITGHPFVDAYGGNPTLHPLDPHVIQVAFSVRKGLFFWTPILAIALAGLWLLRRLTAVVAVASALTLIVHFWIVSSWTQWFYGASLGQRAFVDVLPLFSLGLAAVIAAAFRAAPATRAMTAVAITVTALLAAHATFEYWLGNIPQDLTTWHVYLKSFTQY